MAQDHSMLDRAPARIQQVGPCAWLCEPLTCTLGMMPIPARPTSRGVSESTYIQNVRSALNRHLLRAY